MVWRSRTKLGGKQRCESASSSSAWDGMTVAMQQNEGAYIFLSHSSLHAHRMDEKRFSLYFCFPSSDSAWFKTSGLSSWDHFSSTKPNGQTVQWSSQTRCRSPLVTGASEMIRITINYLNFKILQINILTGQLNVLNVFPSSVEHKRCYELPV